MKKEEKKEKKSHQLKKNAHARETWMVDKRVGRLKQRWHGSQWEITNETQKASR